MLVTLVIENLAIIDQLEIEFGPGLNVLTGETGAGKSIIAGALGLVLGARAQTEVVRHGAEEGRVEALFDIGARPDVAAALAAAGLPAEGGELLIRRVVSRSGRSRVYVNGGLATLQTLTGIVGPLVDVSSQHEQYTLLDTSTHLALLDGFGGLDGDRADVAAAWRELSALRRDLAQLRADRGDRAARVDYLRFQHDEIDGARLQPDEDETLQQERNRLRNAGELRSTAGEALETLYERGGALVQELERVRARLSRLGDLDASVAPLAARVEAARIELEDVAFELRAYRDEVEADPSRLQEVEDRLHLIRALARKHGPRVADILTRREEIAAELRGLETADDRCEALEREIAEREAGLLARARRLSERRREAAGRLEKGVQGTLGALAMERCRLRVTFLDQPAGAEALSADGIDRLELRVMTNTGEGYKPLARIASGGELSRILLALKRALTDAGVVATYVFDEVDSGIGGAVAETVGRLLAETAARHQVLCITHLPQVASFAQRHFRVAKHEHDGRTVTSVRTLSDDARVEEIARMLGGAKLTEKTRAAAAEMIRTAEQAGEEGAEQAAEQAGAVN
jgi:DNA repair protein RecN (Recombination protein N)